MSRVDDSSIRQLTVRGFGPELERAIQRMSRAEGISLNEAVLRLLRKGAGIGPSGSRRDVVGTSLDHLAGTWTADELREFEAATETLGQIDEDLWGKPGRRARGSRRPRR